MDGSVTPNFFAYIIFKYPRQRETFQALSAANISNISYLFLKTKFSTFRVSPSVRPYEIVRSRR